MSGNIIKFGAGKLTERHCDGTSKDVVDREKYPERDLQTMAEEEVAERVAHEEYGPDKGIESEEGAGSDALMKPWKQE